VAYCEKEDLLIGDIPLASKYGDGTSFCELAADEIDAEIGHRYVTPVTFDESSPEKSAAARPSKLLLKKINTLLASGRIIMDMAAGGEDRSLHQYGASMWKEATGLLERICEGKITLLQATLLGGDTDVKNENSRVSVVQADGYSLVQTFYDRYSTPLYPVPPPMIPGELPAARPYDTGVSP
jgi:hypothetical protein